MEEDPEERDAQEGGEDGQRIGESQDRDYPEGDERPQHVEVSLGEVEHLYHPEDERKP